MRGKPQKMPLFPFLKNMEEEFQKSLLGEKFDPPLIEKYKKLSSLFEKIESIQDAILKKQIRKIVLSFPTFLLKQEGENFIDFILSKKYNSQDIESIFIFLGSIKGKWEISDLIAFIISNNTCLPYKELLEKKEKSSLVSFIG